MIAVRVELTETSQPLTYEAENTYTKGDFYCVFTTRGEVHKFPVRNIWRVVENYGSRSGRTA